MIDESEKPEVWLRGKIPDIPDLLQPAAQALLQAREDLHEYTAGFPENLLWKKPAGRASAGFHLQHLTGVLDRMLTYAAGKPLTEKQFSALKNEGNPEKALPLETLVSAYDQKVEEALEIFRKTPADVLTQPRYVGRKKLPSTVLGLYFHAAEHSQRHIGQLLVTASVVKNFNS